MKKRFTEQQIVAILKEGSAGVEGRSNRIRLPIMLRIDKHGAGRQALAQRRFYRPTAGAGVLSLGMAPSDLNCDEDAIDCNKRRTH